MVKSIVKSIAQRNGLQIYSVDHLGVDMESDIKRLSAHSPLKTIFDVGGNFGQTASHFAASFPNAKIFSFEPVPSSFARLIEATKSLDQVQAFNIALGETAGTAKINIHPEAGSNSLNAIEAATATVDVEINSLDRFADANGIESIDLLKIDVEGYELPVLRGSNRRLKDGSIRFVYAECVMSPNSHLPHTSFFDLHKLLDEAGFCFVNYYAESFHLRLGCAMGNVLYALRKSLPEKVPGSVRNIL